MTTFENQPPVDGWKVEPRPMPPLPPEDLTLPRLCELGEN